MADKIATRVAYGKALAEFGSDERIFVMDADLSKSTNTAKFQEVYPERFVNCGIAEGNMISTAAGIAATGKIVFASSFAMFAAGRAFEQIRNSVAYPKLNVKIAASHAGVTVGEDGATHQCLEDIGIMRAIPGMVVLNPADSVETRLAVKAAIEHDGPVYLRLGRLAVETVLDENTYKFEIGKGVCLEDGSDVTIIASGLMVQEAMVSVRLLREKGISPRLINMACIKPIDADMIIKAAKETGAIVTAEEHNINGGLGSAVAEVLAENYPVPMERIGTKDVFGCSGKPAELMKKFGLTAEDIAEAAERVINRK